MSPDNGRLRRARFFAGSDPAPSFAPKKSKMAQDAKLDREAKKKGRLGRKVGAIKKSLKCGK